jgi:cardiolipin synthase
MASEAIPAGGAPAVEPDPLDRIATVPNLITVLRLLFLPVYLYLLLAQDNRMGAAVLLGVLGATDWVDGYIARNFNQKSNIGRLLDPTADRILFFVGIGGILAVDGAPRWFAIIVLAREVVVASITVVLTAMGVEPVEVTWFGKAGTFGLMFAFPFFLAGTSTSPLAPLAWTLGWLAGIPGLILSLYAAVLYVPKWRMNYRLHKAEADA